MGRAFVGPILDHAGDLWCVGSRDRLRELVHKPGPEQGSLSFRTRRGKEELGRDVERRVTTLMCFTFLALGVVRCNLFCCRNHGLLLYKELAKKKVHHRFNKTTILCETYYLKTLINMQTSPSSLKDCLTFNGVVYSTFKDACYARGLFTDDLESVFALKEASRWTSGSSLHQLYFVMVVNKSIDDPKFVWDSTSKLLTKDIFTTPVGNAHVHALIEIEEKMISNGTSLTQYPRFNGIIGKAK